MERWEVAVLNFDTGEEFPEKRFDAETMGAARELALSAAQPERPLDLLVVASIRQVYRFPRTPVG